MFEHLDDPNPPPFGLEARAEVARRSRKLRRTRIVVATAAAVVVIGGGGGVAAAALGGSSIPTSTKANPTIPLVDTGVSATTSTTVAPAPTTTTTVPVVAPSSVPVTVAPTTTTTAAPTTTTTVVPPPLALTNASDGQHYTVPVGTDITVALAPEPTVSGGTPVPWMNIYVADGSSNVLNETGHTLNPDGSIDATFTAVAPGTKQIWARNTVCGQGGPPGVATGTCVPFDLVIYMTVTG